MKTIPNRKLAEVVAIRDALAVIIELDAASPLEVDADTRYDLLANYRLARDASKDYDAAREGLIKQHGVKSPEGNYAVAASITQDGVIRPNPAYLVLLTALTGLLEREVEFSPQTLSVAALKGERRINLSVLDRLMDLSVFTA